MSWYTLTLPPSVPPRQTPAAYCPELRAQWMNPVLFVALLNAQAIASPNNNAYPNASSCSCTSIETKVDIALELQQRDPRSRGGGVDLLPQAPARKSLIHIIEPQRGWRGIGGPHPSRHLLEILRDARVALLVGAAGLDARVTPGAHVPHDGHAAVLAAAVCAIARRCPCWPYP